MTRRRLLWVFVLAAAAVVAVVWLGPSTAFTLAARALVASIVYRLVRRVLR